MYCRDRRPRRSTMCMDYNQNQSAAKFVYPLFYKVTFELQWTVGDAGPYNRKSNTEKKGELYEKNNFIAFNSIPYPRRFLVLWT